METKQYKLRLAKSGIYQRSILSYSKYLFSLEL